MIKQLGFTLTELMIAMLVGLFLLAATMGLFSVSMSSVQSTSHYNQMQESGRMAMRLLQEDLAQVDYFGDMTGQDLVPGINVLTSPSVSTDDCIGGGTNNGSFPNGVGHFRTLWAYHVGGDDDMGCVVKEASNSDVLQIKRLDGIEVESGQELENRYYFTANINESAFYAGDSAITTLDQSRIWPYHHRVYYVRKTKEGVPALHRHSLSPQRGMGDPVALVEGVETLQFEFGVDEDGDSQVDRYLASSSVDNDTWNQVNGRRIMAIRIFLVVRSLEADFNFNPGQRTVFALPSGTRKFKDDNFRRKLFTTTVFLRNSDAIGRRNG